jgi:hypothetical protein
MAKTKRHIDLELKAKLGTHTVPVTEGDWTAFESFRKKKESKRRGYIYLIAATLLFVAVSGMLVWKYQENKPLGQTEKSEKTEPATGLEDKSGTAGKTGSETPGHQGAGEGGQSQESSPSEVPVKENGTQNQETKTRNQETNPQSPIPNSQSPSEVPTPKPGTTDGPITEGPGAPDIQRFPVLSPGGIPFITFHIAPPVLNGAEIPVVTAYEKGKDQDTGKFSGKSRRIPPMTTPSLAFGVVYGFGKPSLTTGNFDSTQTHRQYEKTLKESEQTSQVFRLFAQYEYRMKFGLEFGAGLQFSSVSQVQKYNFEMRDIPYFGPDGSIWFYIPIPPNQAVTPTVFESKQTIMSATVPMSVGYSRNLGSNFRLGVRAGGSIGMNWSKDFTGLSPKTLSETTVKANVNPFNMSYGGGLFGEYFYLRGWSARVSFDWTAQNKLYKDANGYNATNRYYEFKLGVVRYLY